VRSPTAVQDTMPGMFDVAATEARIAQLKLELDSSGPELSLWKRPQASSPTPTVDESSSESESAATPEMTCTDPEENEPEIELPASYCMLAPSQSMEVRQRGAHALASALAVGEIDADILQRRSPMPALIALANEADGCALTLQLVLSCITNISSIVGAAPVVNAAPEAAPALLIKVLEASQDRKDLRGYALAATFNLSSEEKVLEALDNARAENLLRTLAQGESPEAAKHAMDTIKRLRHHGRAASSRSGSARSRPNSASVKQGMASLSARLKIR